MDLQNLLAGGGGALVALLTVIQIAPLKINPWSALAKLIGNAMNRDVLNQMEGLNKQVQDLTVQLDRVKAEAQRQGAINARGRILRFGDEVLHGDRHTKDHFDQILRDIDSYNEYCNTHPDFPNHITELTAKRIEEVYLERLQGNDFL